MAKESTMKDNPVADVLKRLRDEEAELQQKLKPIQEAISALEKIVDKTVKKVKPSAKEGQQVEESVPETVTENE